MSFIDKFLDLTTPLPKKIVRLLKLYKVVEERSRDKNIILKKNREKYLQKIKEKEINNDEIITLKNTIDKQFFETLTLSDYKQELLDELYYILESSFLNKLLPILEEGKKECQEQLISNIQNDFKDIDSLNSRSFNKMNNDDLKIISELNEKKKKNNLKLLGNKKYRQRGRKNIPETELLDDGTQNLVEGDQFCICKGPSFGEMIECEICEEWFHFKCVGIKEGEEPKEWNCKNCEKKLKKAEKLKKKKNASNK